MNEMNRTIQGLLVDYAGSLRDGSIPTFLKSLTREEGRVMASSEQFWDAAEVVRILNGVGFADKVVMPNVGLFISRVNAEIASRRKKARGPVGTGRNSSTRSVEQTKETEKPI